MLTDRVEHNRGLRATIHGLVKRGVDGVLSISMIMIMMIIIIFIVSMV